MRIGEPYAKVGVRVNSILLAYRGATINTLLVLSGTWPSEDMILTYKGVDGGRGSEGV